MKESALLAVALVTSAIGICSLFILSGKLEMEYSNITEIKKMQDYDVVRVTGKVTKVIKKNNLTILTIARQEFLPVVIFENVNVSKGATIDVAGHVKNYKGSPEIIAEKIIAEKT